MSLSILLGVAVSLLAGTVLGYIIRQMIGARSRDSAEFKIKQLLLETKTKAQAILDEAKQKAESLTETAKNEERELKREIRRAEEKLNQKETVIEKQKVKLEEDKVFLEKKQGSLKERETKLQKIEEIKIREVEKIAQMSVDEAKNELIAGVEKKYESDLLGRIKKLERQGEERYKEKAREILASIIQRLSRSTAAEITTTTISIPSEDIKGRIIGKEGRNIRALEKSAGVEIIVDETPNAVVISSFDPLRRETARIALEKLIVDGRIQPARIEETVETAKLELEKIIKETGEETIQNLGIFNLDPKILTLIGRLKFRVSYGQNVLQHSIEMAYLAAMLAEELGTDVQTAKTAALLHDIGKAVDHEVPGSHVVIGKRILEKCNVDKKIIAAMQSHHEEFPYETLESVIVQTADAISASRPGARQDTLENYLKRLEDLEKIVKSFNGIEKTYAIQAGREIRVFVKPESVSDYEAKILARNIADKIEAELKYPGEIKVHLIRESRIIEYAK